MTTTPPGRWNEARWILQVMQGTAQNADHALQRNDFRRAREELSRIRTRLLEAEKHLEDQ